MATAGALPGLCYTSKQQPRGLQTTFLHSEPNFITPPLQSAKKHGSIDPRTLHLGSLFHKNPVTNPRLSKTHLCRASDPRSSPLQQPSPSPSLAPGILQPPQAAASIPARAEAEVDLSLNPTSQGDSPSQASPPPTDSWLGRLSGSFLKPEVEIGFTRSNELIVGRFAMLGFGASLIGEALTGKGTLAQLKMETGIPIYEAEPLLLFFILFTLIGAVRGVDSEGKAKFRNDSEKSQEWPKPKSSSIRGFLGLPEQGPLFSFSTSNELFVGRVAQVGFACSLIGEILTGKGALAQLRLETGIPVTEVEPLIILSIAFFFLSAINPETGRFFRNEDDDQ